MLALVALVSAAQIIFLRLRTRALEAAMGGARNQPLPFMGYEGAAPLAGHGATLTNEYRLTFR